MKQRWVWRRNPQARKAHAGGGRCASFGGYHDAFDQVVDQVMTQHGIGVDVVVFENVLRQVSQDANKLLADVGIELICKVMSHCRFLLGGQLRAVGGLEGKHGLSCALGCGAVPRLRIMGQNRPKSNPFSIGKVEDLRGQVAWGQSSDSATSASNSSATA